jgi:hypothetical protein
VGAVDLTSPEIAGGHRRVVRCGRPKGCPQLVVAVSDPVAGTSRAEEIGVG